MDVATATEILMPQLSDSMEEGTILSWLIAAGAAVEAGQDLLEVETDKAAMTMLPCQPCPLPARPPPRKPQPRPRPPNSPPRRPETVSARRRWPAGSPACTGLSSVRCGAAASAGGSPSATFAPPPGWRASRPRPRPRRPRSPLRLPGQALAAGAAPAVEALRGGAGRVPRRDPRPLGEPAEDGAVRERGGVIALQARHGMQSKWRSN